jgi:hypothetical protein
MAVPIGIAFAAKLRDLKLSLTSSVGQNPEQASYGSVLLILSVITLLALALYLIFIRMLEHRDEVAGVTPA